MVEVYEANELSDSMHGRWAFPLGNGGDLFIIHFEPISTDIHTQELDLCLVELALLWVAEELHLPKVLEGAADSAYVLLFTWVMIQGIIQVVLEVLIEQGSEDLVHVLLETRWRVGEPKSHYAEPEWSEWGHERRLPFVSRSDSDLVVSQF